MSKATTRESFLAKLTVENGCWIYPAKPNHDGYVRCSIKGRKMMTHRFALAIHNIEIPDGFEVDHLCRNRACCNPAHLEVVDHTTNMRRGTGMDRIHAAKTHCAYGHRFTADSTYLTPKGFRQCKVCRRIKDRVRDKAGRRRKPLK